MGMTMFKTFNESVRRYWIVALSFLIFPAGALAQTFPLSGYTEVVGQIQTTTVKPGESFAQVARDFDMGYTELLEANPGVDPDAVQPNTVLIVPSQFVLPNAPHDGLVVNLAEMRVYYYPKGGREVVTYPIGIGREGEDTPVGVLKVIQHIVKPTWNVPESIRKMRATQGVILPKMVPPGPENPLGDYAMRLSNMTYLIHGTNDPLGGIGRRSSSGCLRLYPEDIDPLFHMVPQGTNVYIVNEPYKAGWLGSQLYLESHVPLQDKADQALDDATQLKNVIQIATQGRSADINWHKAFDITEETQGLPQIIGRAG